MFAFHEVLEKEGYTSIEAHDGAEALVKFAAEQPHVVFLDIALPDCSGFDVLKKIKRQNESIPVVMITGHGSRQNESTAAELRAFDYLTKPLSIVRVRGIIHKALMEK